MTTVFISYETTTGMEFAKHLQKALKKHDISSFVARAEISAAYHKKPRKPIYVFAEKGVPVPLLINYITVYATYDPVSQETLDGMAYRVQEIASTYKRIEDKGKAAFAIIMGVLGIGFLVALAKS